MTYLIVGISGATCSGKSSITTNLQKKFKNSIMMKQDDYFLPQNDSRHILIPELNHFNWEILSSLDMKKMHDDVLKFINFEECEVNNVKRLLIIEGFSIFNYKPIAQLCNCKYFIEISKELCWSRRKIRSYDPPDVPGYFDKVVWPEYLRHKSEVVSDADFYKTIKILDGNKSLDELCDEITNDLCIVLQ